MSFDNLALPVEKRIRAGLVCNETTCDCENCSVSDLCDGPSSRCDAKLCSTRTRQPEGCYACRAICSRHFAAKQIVESLQGASFDDVIWKPFQIELPPILFQINSLVYDRPQHTFLINAKKLTYNDSENWSPQKNLWRRFKIPRKCQLGLSFFTNDIWMDRYSQNIPETCKKVSAFKPDFAFGMDFSCYENYPRFDTIVNLRRRMLSVRLMQDNGINVIPALGWTRGEDLERTASWCKDNKILYAAINMQTVAVPVHNPEWKRYLSELKVIRDAVPNCKLLMVGSSAPKRMRSIMEAIGPVHIVDAKSYRFAEYHKDITGKVYPKSVPVLDLFERNADYLNRVHSEIIKDVC